jgi:flagellar biosynthesis protein FliQ
MTYSMVLDLAREALWVALLMAGPLLAVALFVGLAVGILQAVTSVQEQTLSFVPKLFAIGLAFLFLLPWMVQRMVQYTIELFQALPGAAQ